MEKRTQNYNLEEIIERMDKKKLSFDYPIQRESGQWDKSQKSLLIDSILNGYFLPEIYIIREGTEDFAPMSVLDGKQRLTTLYEFAKDGFALSNDLDDVTVVDVFFDEESKLYWVYYQNKRLYLKRSINTVQSVLEVMNMLAAEQEPASPHCYVDDAFNVSEGDIVFDIGCAEGNFALSIVDLAEKIYMFEADEEWIEALNYTFKPYKDKISIIPKFVSDKNATNSISIDTFCDKNQIHRIHFMKMDVEGAEPDVLRGAEKLIGEGKIEKIVACTYHNADDENKIRQILCILIVRIRQGSCRWQGETKFGK